MTFIKVSEISQFNKAQFKAGYSFYCTLTMFLKIVSYVVINSFYIVKWRSLSLIFFHLLNVFYPMENMKNTLHCPKSMNPKTSSCGTHFKNLFTIGTLIFRAGTYLNKDKIKCCFDNFTFF